MKLTERIKNVLINLATNDKLPLDLNELDPQVFEEALKVDEDIIKDVQHHTLNQFLSDYPIDTEYNTILDLLSTDTIPDSIKVWEPFEYKEPSTLAAEINSYFETALSLVNRTRQ